MSLLVSSESQDESSTCNILNPFPSRIVQVEQLELRSHDGNVVRVGSDDGCPRGGAQQVHWRHGARC